MDCIDLREQVFNDSAAAAYLQVNFVPFYVDFAQNQDLCKQLRFGSIPGILLFNVEGKEVNRLYPYSGPVEKYIERLKQTALQKQ